MVDIEAAPEHIGVVRIGAEGCVVAEAAGIVGIAAAAYKAGYNQADIVVQPLLVPVLARVDEFPALEQAALSLVAEVYIEVAALLAVVAFEHTECSAPEFQDAVAFRARVWRAAFLQLGSEEVDDASLEIFLHVVDVVGDSELLADGFGGFDVPAVMKL